MSILEYWLLILMVMFALVQPKNPNTPVSTLQILATYSNYSIDSSLADNPNTPESILAKLATYSNYYCIFVLRVAKHLNTPTERLSNTGY